MSETLETEAPPKVGAWRGGMLLARASWSVLKMDKELMLFPILSAASSLILLSLVGLVAWLTGLISFADLTSESGPAALSGWQGYLTLFFCYLLVAISTNFFAASIISSALYRFKGGDPTLSYGISQARKRFGSLVSFSLLSSTVGIILKIIEDKSSLIGRIVASIVGVAWSVVTVFAIPAIVVSEKPVSPFEAVKRSVEIFKKVWAKNAVGNLGIGLVFFLAFIIWLLLSGISMALLISLSPVLLFVAVPISAIILVILIALSSALSSIFQAALYHYATVGESPVEFDKNLLKAAFKPRGKWFA